LPDKPQSSAVAGAPPATHDLLVGSAFGALTVLMFALWIIGTRFAARTTLGPFDIAFVRYLTASVVLTPFVLRNGFGLWRAGLGRSTIMACGAGLPFLLASSTGMRFAPASAAGADGRLDARVRRPADGGSRWRAVRLDQGRGPSERDGRHRLLHLAQPYDLLPGAWVGFALFLVAGALWAGYTVAFRRSGIGPWSAAAIINFGSLLALTPIYFLFVDAHLGQAAWGDILLQAFVQAGISAIAGLYFYGRSIGKLGASRAAVVASFTPVAVGPLGIPLLGEFPDFTGWIGIVLVTLGVASASAGPSRPTR
jgi:threonine/homoserine efflux transporter RhtA